MWKAGDAEELEQLLITKPLKERPELRGVFVKLFDERNAKMAAKIDALLRKPRQTQFVVVGAGHLIGDKGIVRLLEKKGYRVEQVTREGRGVKKPAPREAPARKGYAPADAWAK
jgi:uncharacterized protein YbaP (TraB family)